MGDVQQHEPGEVTLSRLSPAPAAASPVPSGLLLVQQLLDPAQRSAQGLGVGARTAQRQRGLKLGSDGIRYGLQRFRCISLHSAALHCVPGTIYQSKCAGFRNWSAVKRILF